MLFVIGYVVMILVVRFATDYIIFRWNGPLDWDQKFDYDVAMPFVMLIWPLAVPVALVVIGANYAGKCAKALAAKHRESKE